MKIKEQILPMYKQQVFDANEDLFLRDKYVIFDTVELCYLDCCGREHSITENPILTKNNEGYQISFKGHKKNLKYLVKYFYLIEKSSIELSQDEIPLYTNTDGSMTIPYNNYMPHKIHFWDLSPRLYIKEY